MTFTVIIIIIIIIIICQQTLAPLLAPRDLLTLSIICRSLKPARYCIPQVG
jgi:hypothetical protein